MTDYRAAVADYLAVRRALGYKLFYQGKMLTQFAVYLDEAGAEHLTIDDAVRWARQPSAGARSWWACRLSTVRAFARYLSAIDPATEIPPPGLIPDQSHRVVPYIYSAEDVGKVIAAAGRLPSEHRADTYQTLIALAAVTGMRAGELTRLDHEDVDLVQGLLTIRDSKFGKSRQIPVHPSTVEALAGYARRRDSRADTAPTGEPTVTGPRRASSPPPPAPACCATTSAACSPIWSVRPGSSHQAAALPVCMTSDTASPSIP